MAGICYTYFDESEIKEVEAMQNTEIEKAIPWNPWHGCKKVSPGCKNCFVYKMD